MGYIANPGTGKVHSCDCCYAAASFEIVGYDMLHEALAAGYVEGGCCLSDRSTRVANTSRAVLAAIRDGAGASCCVCGHSRRVERAHIIPRHAGGSRTAPLCPNCHQAFDFGQMADSELAQLSKYCARELGIFGKQVRECHGWGRAA